MKFETFEKEGYLEVAFPQEVIPHKWLLSCFLADARNDIESRLEEIEKAEKGQDVPTGIVSNSVDTNFYPNKAVITALWFNDEGVHDENNYASMEIPLSEAKQLLLDWQKALNEWEAKRN